MGAKASVRSVATTVYQAARDDGSNLLDSLKEMNAESRKTALETNIKDGDDLATPLIIAARDGKLDFVKVLLRYEANVEARGTIKVDGENIDDGCTALWIAAANGHLAVVRLLIEQNAEVDARTSQTGSTPLRAAAFDGHLDIVRCLVENGADVNARTIFCHTPLMVACYFGHIDVASYLVENGADIHLEDHNGDTSLHHAVSKGHVEVVGRLLALGAEQKQNHKYLTPLLAASNDCNIEMVEYIVTRPECAKETRVEALELLGATIATDSDDDIEKAFSYMKRGMEERYEDLSCLLLKKKMEPVEAYQNRTESQTLEELSLLEGDDHAIAMEGLLIRERILGTDNTELCFPIKYRGAVLLDSKEYELGIALFKRAMGIAMNRDVPGTAELDALTDVFAEMVQNGHNLSPKNIENIFENLVDGNRRLTEALKSEEQKKEAQQKLLFCALYLLIICKKVQASQEMINCYIINFLQRFLRLNPRSHSDGNTLLHLAVWHKTPVSEFRVQSVCKLPCIETMRLILHAGCEVNAVNNEGNTPLHLAVTFVPGSEQEETLKEMLELLLDLGADTKLVNLKGQTAMDCCETDEARRILYEKEGLKPANIDTRKVRKV